MVDKIKVSELLLDYELYPRDRIEPFNVTQMIEALKAGRELPPIVVDRKSRRVVDGFHRVRAYQKLYGLDAEIPVELKDYEGDAQMFCSAVSLNANHGRQLSTYDRARCIAKAETFKLEPEAISAALNMTPQRIAEMKVERFNSELCSLENVKTALVRAGQAVGLLDFRPAKRGWFGKFEVKDIWSE